MRKLLLWVKGGLVNSIGSAWVIRSWFKYEKPGNVIKLFIGHAVAYIRSLLSADRYIFLNIGDLMAKRRTSRIFVFGSGYSINEISEDEWKDICRYDSIGFNGAFHLNKVPFTYFLLRAGHETLNGFFEWRIHAEYILNKISTNSVMHDTAFLFPRGFVSEFTNRLIGYRLWESGRPIFKFFTDRISRRPNKNLEEGLVHRAGTLCSAISFAVAMGYKEIVLVGVDLYDNRYFWVSGDKTLAWDSVGKKEIEAESNVRGLAWSSKHNTVNNGVIDIISNWARILEMESSVKLSVYNPKSLLAVNLAVFSWATQAA